MTTTMGKADIIWLQIPRRIKVALNLREPVGDNQTGYLHFRIGACREALDKVVIQLAPTDTYTIKLIRIARKTWEVRTLYEVSDIYADQLGEVLDGFPDRLKGRELRGNPMTTAEEWLGRAREYRAASQVVPAGNPKVFLALHGVELLLKARLHQMTEEPGDLMMTHDFAVLMRAEGVDVGSFQNLVQADPKMTYFRYPKPLRPALDLDLILKEADAMWEEIGGPA